MQREAGGTWVVADVQPGTRDREQQLKERGATRRCQVCQAMEGYQAGKLTQPEALAHAGWARATPYERGLLLDMLGMEQAPENMPEPEPLPQRTLRPAPDVQVVEATAELEALVDALEARWRQEAQAAARGRRRATGGRRGRPDDAGTGGRARGRLGCMSRTTPIRPAPPGKPGHPPTPTGPAMPRKPSCPLRLRRPAPNTSPGQPSQRSALSTRRPPKLT